jgi:hypothetical protein
MLRDDEGVGTMGEASLVAVVTQHPGFTMLAIAIAKDTVRTTCIKLEKKIRRIGQSQLTSLTTVGSRCSLASDSAARQTESIVGTAQGGIYDGSSAFLDLPRVLCTAGGKREGVEGVIGLGARALPLSLPLPWVWPVAARELVR